MAAGRRRSASCSSVVLALPRPTSSAGRRRCVRGRELSRVSAATTRSGRADELLPVDVARRLLAVDDDVAFRESSPRVAARASGRPDRLRLRSRGGDQPERGTDPPRGSRRRRRRPRPTLACRGSPRRARAREIRHGDPGARGAPVEHGREPPARDRARSLERRGEAQPRARVSARTRLPARRRVPGAQIRRRVEAEPRAPARAIRARDTDGERASSSSRPLGAVLAIGVLLPLTALFFIHRRAQRVRGSLGAIEPSARHLFVAVGAVIAAGAFLGAAAAQPVLQRTSTLRTRTDAEAFIVVDISRSMLARHEAGSPTRIARAKAFAAPASRVHPRGARRHRLTDRSDAPASLPRSRRGRLQRDARSIGRHRAAAAEVEPGDDATKLDALATIRSQRYFTPKSRKRLVVVLTDGESQPVSAARLSDVFRQVPAIETVFVQFWGRDERVFAGDAPERGYRPDPSARPFLERLGRAVDGSVYGEDELVQARQDVRTAPRLRAYRRPR